MSNNNVVLKRWEERVISNEKGSRIVHYRVVDNHGNSLLTIVGRERNQTHMTYTAKRDFGPMSTIRAGTTWNSRTSVVELLSSITSANDQIIADSSGEQKFSLATHPKKAWMARFSSMSNDLTHEEGSTQPLAEGCSDLHQAKKARAEKRHLLWGPHRLSDGEGSREASTSEGKKMATSSSIVDNKRRRRA